MKELKVLVNQFKDKLGIKQDQEVFAPVFHFFR